MLAEIVIVHLESVPADGRADIGDDLLDLGPGVHALAVVVPLVVVELERALAVAPRPDAEFLLGVAEVLLHRVGLGVVGEFAAGGAPAVFGQVFGAGDALVDGHGGLDGAASPVEGVDVAELVGVEHEVAVGGELGLRVGVEVVGGAVAGGLADGVEVQGPPDRVPDLEVLGPVTVLDGAGVGGVPGLVEVDTWGVNFVGQDGSVFFDGVAKNSVGDAVEDDDGAGAGFCGLLAVCDGKCWPSRGDWIEEDCDAV